MKKTISSTRKSLSLLRQLPSVDQLINNPDIKKLAYSIDKTITTKLIRDELNEIRNQIQEKTITEFNDKYIIDLIKKKMNDLILPSLFPVINVTGTVLHTNLGRALLPRESIQAMEIVASSPVNLEYDIEKGERGDRDSHLEKLLYYLTGAKESTVVNNNAASVLLALNSISEGKEVIVSRGELIEIGGSFRLPEIMKKSGCKLVEVGTTNRTHPKDYINAINKNTGLILKAHTSNYRVVGFTKDVSLNELVEISHQKKIPVMIDLGSGAFIDFSKYGLPKEETVQEVLKTNVDIVTFSGDKLLGGIQAGFILGKEKYLKSIKRNPLKRVLRLDKIAISILESILKLYLHSNQLTQRIPTIYWLTRSLSEIEKVAIEVKGKLLNKFGKDWKIEIMDDYSEVGSGSMPGSKIATKCIVISSKEKSVKEIAAFFRKNKPPIIGRVHSGKFIMDMRMIENPESVIPNIVQSLGFRV